MFIKKELSVVLVDNDIDTDRTFNVISESILTWENSELKNELNLSREEIQILLSKLSVSNSEVDTLTTCLREVVSDQEIGKQTIIDLQKELSEVKFNQELCSIKLNESIQKLNTLNPKNIKRTIDRREQKISELTGVNDRVVKKLNESLLNEEKLKDEIKNSSLQSIEYQQEIDHLNKLLDESLIWKTKHQKLKWYHKFAMERKNNKNEILGTSYDAIISELKQQISILENEKCEVEEKLSSYMEGLMKTKENGHYNDTVRATYQDLVMMGVGINNIEKVVRTVLTNFTNMNIKRLTKATFARLMYTESRRLSQLQVAESLLKDYDSSCRTLHTDGTSKFGKHYGTYDVVTDQGQTLIAGIREVSSSDTETQLNVLLIFCQKLKSLCKTLRKMFPIKFFHQ